MAIPTFWLIERGEDGAPIVHEHHLAAGHYGLVKTHVGTLRTDRPFLIDIPLVEPTARGGR